MLFCEELGQQACNLVRCVGSTCDQPRERAHVHAHSRALSLTQLSVKPVKRVAAAFGFI